ncbi:hypothetical protein ACPFUN_002505 [Vibrio cholerae]
MLSYQPLIGLVVSQQLVPLVRTPNTSDIVRFASRREAIGVALGKAGYPALAPSTKSGWLIGAQAVIPGSHWHQRTYRTVPVVRG